MQDVDQLDLIPKETPAPSPRAADWFWRPWYAKLYWALALLYWIGLELMITMPYDQWNITLANMMVLLIFVFCRATFRLRKRDKQDENPAFRDWRRA